MQTEKIKVAKCDYKWQLDAYNDRIEHPEKYIAIGEDVNAAIDNLTIWLETHEPREEQPKPLPITKHHETLSVFDYNDTMRIMGKQCYFKLFADAYSDIADIRAAHSYKCDYDLYELNIFTLGIIYGKRAERARRKKTA